MHHNSIRQKTVAVNSNSDQVIQSEVKNEQVQTHELTIPDIAIFLSPAGFIIGWIGFFVILRKIRVYLDDKVVFSIDGLQKVPCKNCQFYCNNHYLKCAVNPSIVLTKEAMSCSEYSPTKKKFLIKILLAKKNNYRTQNQIALWEGVCRCDTQFFCVEKLF